MAQNLKSANGELLGNILDLFKRHQVSDQETCRILASLLQSENNFLAQKAFSYLKNLNIGDKLVEQQVNAYKLKHNL